MTGFNRDNCTAQDLQDRNPDVSAGTCEEVYQLTLRRSDERPRFYYTSIEDAGGVWLAVVNTNTYGACRNQTHMIETNEAAAAEMLDGVDASFDYDSGMLCALVCDSEGIIHEDALNTVNEILEALENYPLLDEDAYCQACFDEACETIGDAISDVVREQPADLLEELEELDLDADMILDCALGREGDIPSLEWEEVECYAHIDTRAAEQVLRDAIDERRAEHALGEVLSGDNQTLDMFED